MVTDHIILHLITMEETASFNPREPLSPKNHPGKRRLDRGKNNWGSEIEQDRIVHRIFFTGPGEPVELRAGTDDILYDNITGSTWRDVTEVLDQQGVLSIHEDGTIVKTEEGFGGDDVKKAGYVPKYHLGKIMEERDKKTLNAMNLHDPEQFGQFITTILLRGIRESHYRHRAHDFTGLLPALAEVAIRKISIARDMQADEATQNKGLVQDFLAVLQANGVIIGKKFDTVTYNGEEKFTYVYQMLWAWVNAIRWSLADHPSTRSTPSVDLSQ